MFIILVPWQRFRFLFIDLVPKYRMFWQHFLAMHITNEIVWIYMVGHLQNIFMEHDFYLIS